MDTDGFFPGVKLSEYELGYSQPCRGGSRTFFIFTPHPRLHDLMIRKITHVKFPVFTAVCMKMTVFRDKGLEVSLKYTDVSEMRIVSIIRP
jgi:hypothetical protein